MAKRNITYLTDACLITCVVQKDLAEPILEAGEIKTLPDHHAIVTHPNGKFARGFIQPYDKEGNPFTPASA